MEIESTKALMSTTSPDAAKFAEDETAQVAPASPWEEYLTGKKVSAASFLAKMSNGSIITLDEATRDRFAEALVAKPDRVERLILLLQASAASSTATRRIVGQLAEVGIRRLGIVTFPEPLDGTSFNQAVSSWVNGNPHRPLKPTDLNMLFLLLNFGRHMQWLDEETGFSLVASATSKPTKPGAPRTRATESVATLLDVLLATMPAAPVLTLSTTYFEASKAATNKLNATIQSQGSEIQRLRAECARLNAAITNLHVEITTTQEQKAAAETTIVELEKQIVEMQDGYQHKLNELRGRTRGMLQGQLTRWLETALDASQSDPPWTKAIQERLEDALKLIEKEVQWLQPSA